MEIGNSELPPIKQEGSPKKGLVQSAKEWGQNLAGIFNKKLEGERKPGEPKISIHIFYSPHRTAEDFKGLRKEVQECDVYAPEVPGWDLRTLTALNNSSVGKVGHSAREIFPTDNDARFMHMTVREVIHNSNKPIVLLDLPHGHFLINEIKQSFRLMNNIEIKFGNDSFDIMISKYKEVFKKIASLQQRRESFMSAQIQPKMQELFEQYPGMKEKKEIRLLMSLGTGHTSLFYRLKAEGQRVSRSFNRNPVIFGLFEEVVRTYTFDKKVSDEAIAKYVLLGLFDMYFSMDISKNSGKIAFFKRKIVSQFKFQEIKGMFEGVSNEDEFKRLFEEKLKEKGLSIPKSEEELDEFLARPLPRKTAG